MNRSKFDPPLGSGPDTQRVMITPAMAEQWLKRNLNNYRPLDRALVAEYAAQMKNGMWVFNGDSVCFDTEGRLLDAQHRLSACVSSGVSFEAIVTQNLPPEAADTKDRGRKRSISSDLAFRGEQNCTATASAGCWLATWRSGKLTCEIGALPSLIRPKPVAALLHYINQEPEFRDSVSFICKNRELSKILMPSVGSFLHYVFGLQDRQARDRFMEGLATGANLAEDSPILKLYRRLIGVDLDGDEGSPRRSATRMKDMVRCALIITAWNAHLNGRRVKFIRWTASGAFPNLPQFPASANARIA